MQKNWKKNLILFLSSQTISLMGTMLVQYAITWYITLETQSGAMMTISIIAGFLPTFFLSPFAGVWADRYDRKKLIAISDSLIALATLVLAIFFLKGYNSIWLLFATSAIRAFGSGIQTPAVGAILPQLVPEDELTKANATNSSIQAVVMLISPMISGALLSFASIELIFFIDVITALIAVIILLFFLDVPLHAKALQKGKISYFADLRQGLNYIKNHKFVKTIFIFNAFFFVFIGPLSFLTPLQVTRSFGDDVWRLTVIEVVFSVGMIIGGVVMASWGGFKNRLHSMALSNIVISLCTLALGILPNFWLYCFVMAIIGIAMPLFNTPFTVLLQERVSGDFLGRVFGALGMISSSVMPLSMLVYGPVSDHVRIEYLLIGTGLILLVQSLIMLSNKILLKAGEPVAKENV